MLEPKHESHESAFCFCLRTVTVLLPHELQMNMLGEGKLAHINKFNL